MREIPAEVATLLKSRSMIGNNKPVTEVTVEGLSSGYDWESNTWQKVSTTIDGDLTVAKKNNGKLICVISSSGTFYEGECESVDVLLTQNDSVINWVQIPIMTVRYGHCAISRVNNELFLSVTDAGLEDNITNAAHKLYKSPSGNGGDWEYYSTISSRVSQNLDLSSSLNFNGTGCITKLANGRWIMPGGYFLPINGSTIFAQYYGVFISDDNGVTWILKYTLPTYMLNMYYEQGCPKRVVQLENGDICVAWCSNDVGAYYKISISNDNGNTWSLINNYMESTYWAWNFAIIGNGNNGLYVYCNDWNDSGSDARIYEISTPSDLPTDQKRVCNLPNLPTYNNTGNGFNPTMQVIDGKLVITKDTFVLGIESVKISLPVKSINISRNKNMAGSLNLSIDNKDGIWSPDNTFNQNVLFPNKEVTVKQGYGVNLIQTFNGLIDRIEMTTFPQEIKLSVRDKLKLALDQIITWTDGATHVILFQSQPIETIFTTLCGYAGLTIGTIEITGLTITKTFSWETYADCFQWLADLVGFECGANEDGLIYFRKDTTPTEPIIAYEFKEGEDIISLGYTIDDNDLYSKVVVYGKDINDNVIFAQKEYVSKDYYNVLPQKLMKIDVSEASTVEQLQAIADRAEMLMRSRVREVSFAAIAVPWLQVGDIIRVVESSTTISELYRVTDLSTNMDSNGYTMQITCYHHGT